jgi:hypothetical protein
MVGAENPTVTEFPIEMHMEKTTASSQVAAEEKVRVASLHLYF